jgi:hypothetical protein
MNKALSRERVGWAYSHSTENTSQSQQNATILPPDITLTAIQVTTSSRII